MTDLEDQISLIKTQLQAAEEQKSVLRDEARKATESLKELKSGQSEQNSEEIDAYKKKILEEFDEQYKKKEKVLIQSYKRSQRSSIDSHK